MWIVECGMWNVALHKIAIIKLLAKVSKNTKYAKKVSLFSFFLSGFLLLLQEIQTLEEYIL